MTSFAAAASISDVTMTLSPAPPNAATWLELREFEIFQEENLKYEKEKKSIRRNIKKLRNTVS